ncbi:MAG: c-type cytochrome [Candidatus Obscuribacterales bacterium]|nr:c-type cytochrome [Candidatus Obscuribacterales bacterium]
MSKMIECKKNGGWTKVFCITVMALCLVLPSIAEEVGSNLRKKSISKSTDGKKVFQQHCSRCHFGGGNLVKPLKSVAGSEKLDNLLVFKAYLAAPPGHMPSYENVVNDEAVLRALYDYCKTLDAAKKISIAKPNGCDRR